MRVAYVRVSTLEQNEERQIEALKVHNIEKWFIEKVYDASSNTKFCYTEKRHNVHQHTSQTDKLSTKAVEEYLTREESKEQG